MCGIREVLNEKYRDSDASSSCDALNTFGFNIDYLIAVRSKIGAY
jgi:hypothetical protein